jgi:hypothetical protein
MTKELLKLFIVITVLCVSFDTAAQSDVALATRSSKLQALSAQLKARDHNDRLQAQDIARRAGIPFRRELPNGKILELQRIAPDIGPVFYITNNVDAADTVSTDEVYPGGSAGLSLDGSGMTVGEWDGGAVAEHPDYISRTTQVDGATLMSNHSTHVAGTLVGDGLSLLSEARGMAYAAQLHAYDWNSDTAEMALAAANGLLFSNHSYGIAAGWLYLGGAPPDTWWWIGGADPADIEDPNFGYYDSESQLWDQIAFDAPYYLIVKAAGNDRSDIGPAPGELYTVIDQDGNFLFTSTLARQPDCWPAGYDCMPTHSGAKNILTVGAVDDLIGGYSDFSGASSVQMADFSDWGPTDDGRIKPDIVGNGVFLMSTWGENPFFAAAAGTSMATPNVTGSLVLLQEHYENLNGNSNFMRAATLKALAIHTADEAGDSDGPDYEFGWGLLNTKTAAKVITENGGAHKIIEGTLANGGTSTVNVNVPGANDSLTATLVWADPAGTPVPPSLDPTDLMLVNDLDLRITKSPVTYMPWVLNPAAPADAATTGDNFRDNVEQVVINGGGSGTYTIEVSHKGTLLNNLSQDYSLIISVTPPPPVGSTILVDEDFSGGLPAGWSIETTLGTSWTINSPVAGDPRLDNLTGGSGNFAMVDVDFSNFAMTSLVMPTFDLSSSVAAVLHFKSYFSFDLYESINVDISTDGGTGWTNVWTFQGFNPFPTQYVLDLTGVAAGQANVTLRFRFNSFFEILGNLWQVDDVELEVFGGGPPPGDPPGQASSPVPADGSSSISINADISWTAGTLTDSHDVYFGTNPTPAFAGNQSGTTYDPGTLAYSTTYYWQINEVNADGTTAGNTWSFTTEADPSGDPPGQATAPNPTDGASGQGINTTVNWTAGSLATSHDVYFGTNPAPAYIGNQTGTTYDPGALAYSTTYYWQIDEVNADGTTPGAVWSFTTEAGPPPSTVHLANLLGYAEPAPKGRWNAFAQISVEDAGGSPVADITVNGDWSNGANGGASCFTDTGGQCTVQKNNLKGNASPVTFTVTGMSGASHSYDSNDNEVADFIPISKDDVVQLPTAVNDEFSTEVDTPVIDNVINNDDQGNAPASINSHSSPSDGNLVLAADGDFTYTPNPGYEGVDSFTYSIIDADNDISNTATVTITVSSTPPPPGDDPTVSVNTYKVKGVQHVDLTWTDFTTTNVSIARDGAPITTTLNNGAYTDNIGNKGGGSYFYEICEVDPAGACANATAVF